MSSNPPRDRLFRQLQAVLATLAPGQGAEIPVSAAGWMDDFELPPGVVLYCWSTPGQEAGFVQSPSGS